MLIVTLVADGKALHGNLQSTVMAITYGGMRVEERDDNLMHVRGSVRNMVLTNHRYSTPSHYI